MEVIVGDPSLTRESRLESVEAQESPVVVAPGTVGKGANRLIHRYLTAESDRERGLIFGEVVAYCLGVLDSEGLFIAPQRSDAVTVHPEHKVTPEWVTRVATREFVIIAALEYLARFDGLSREEIDALAVAGKLGFVGIFVRNKLINRIDKDRNDPDSRSFSLDYVAGYSTDGPEFASMDIPHDAGEHGSSLYRTGDPQPRYSPSELKGLVGKLEKQLTEREFRILGAIIGLYPHDLDEHERDGKVTRAVAEELNVGEPHARKLVKALQKRLTKERESLNRNISRLSEALRDYERPLRESDIFTDDND